MNILQDETTEALDQLFDVIADIDYKLNGQIHSPMVQYLYISLQDKLLKTYCDVTELWGNSEKT